MHWADKQKPLQEVAGQFGVFPQAIESPPLVPEEIDEEAPLPAEEVTLADEEATLVCPPEGRVERREPAPEIAA